MNDQTIKSMTKSEILLRAMQIAGIPNVDENRVKMVLAFAEKLEQFGLGLSIREIEATGLAVTKQIQADNAKAQMIAAPAINKMSIADDAVELPISKGGEA